MLARWLVPTFLLSVLLAASPALAATCDKGTVLEPGESCDLTVKWGTDHWIVADFPTSGGNGVVFSHLEGKCSVSLFGPVELETDLLSPGQDPTRSAVPGEYHLFTRAITVAQETCRYRIAVD